MAERIEIYDTTLRDGTQGESISFSVADKCKIAHVLDELGISHIEGGWPGSNPRDMEFFERARSLRLKHARIAAFGSTRRKQTTCARDKNIQALLHAETPVVTIFGKSWLLHVSDALRSNPNENLELIADSVKYLSQRVDELIYDAEHFFDGYRADPDYALKTLQTAARAGAARIVLCDTNGGSLPEFVSQATVAVRKALNIPLGIHCHNDSELAVANTLAAVQAGATQVQGTFNGYGERCGNANLCSIIPNLELKLGRRTLGPKNLKRLREAARIISELANLPLDNKAAFIGESAFAHKGGVHVSAVERNPQTYEHIDPSLVGNHRRVLVSDLAGRANLLAKARELGLALPDGPEVLNELKRLENDGYEFEAAEASFELLVHKLSGAHQPYFELLSFRVIDEHRGASMPLSEATLRVQVGAHIEHTVASGTGPVDALDSALRAALEKFYPQLREVRLVDYKVRVIPGSLKGTASQVRVMISSADGRMDWGTVGVSTNIVDASWRALVDAVEYKLMKDKIKPRTSGPVKALSMPAGQHEISHKGTKSQR